MEDEWQEDDRENGKQDVHHEFDFKWDVSSLEHHVALNIFEKRIEIDHVTLPPFWLSDPLKGVAEDLDGNLGRWKKSLNSYLVAYENIKYNGNTVANMYVDQPWLHIDILATFYTYKPSVGQILTGTIKKVGVKAALCVVFNYFAVSVFPTNPKEELRIWGVGAEIKFKVTAVQNRRKGPVIRAMSCEYDYTLTGELKIFEMENEIILSDDSPRKVKKKKSKLDKKATEVVDLEDQPLWGNEPDFYELGNEVILLEESPKKEKRKKLKRKHREANDIDAENPWDNEFKVSEVKNEVVVFEELPKMKKRKEKKNKSKLDKKATEVVDLEDQPLWGNEPDFYEPGNEVILLEESPKKEKRKKLKRKHRDANDIDVENPWGNEFTVSEIKNEVVVLEESPKMKKRKKKHKHRSSETEDL